MMDVIFFVMLALFLIGTPVLLYASWADEYFAIIKQARPKQPQFANWLCGKADKLAQEREERGAVLVLVRG
jgi:hypothetical protein